MSILNGDISFKAMKQEIQPYGQQLSLGGTILLDRAMDAAILHNEFLVVACSETLEIFHLEDKPKFIARLTGIGESRQLCIDGDWAYVSARADGVFVCDLSDPGNPRIAEHIDSLELATGVCAADGLLAVANRHMGVELYDVRDPRRPVFLSHFLCGEAQSVWLHDNIALVGDWVNRQVLLYDIRDAGNPEYSSRFGVDGFADGVCAFEAKGRTLCLAATGHHSAGLKNRNKYRAYTYVTPRMLQEGYGCGHGIEIYDISDPLNPEYLSALKTPPHFGGIDTWRVFSDGEICYFTDSINGLFAISISDPLSPDFLWHVRLPLMHPQKLMSPTIQPLAEQISGVAAVGEYVFVTSPQSGLHWLRMPKVQSMQTWKRPWARVDFRRGRRMEGAFFSGAEQVHSFAEYQGFLYAACGREGIAVIEVSGGTCVYRKQTGGICYDLSVHKGVLISAEGQRGVASYRIEEGELIELSRVEWGSGLSVREIVAGDDICVQLGCKAVAKAAVDSDGKLYSAGEVIKPGLLYYRHIARTKWGAYFCTLPITTGPGLIEETEAGLYLTKFQLGRTACPFEEGACGYGERLICILNRKYFCLEDPNDLPNLPEDMGRPVQGAQLKGIPFVCGKRLVLLNRCTGIVEVLDIANPHEPVLIQQVKTGKHPEFAAVIGKNLYIACGHDGIWRI